KSKENIQEVLELLLDIKSIRKTARLLKISKDTIRSWLMLIAKQPKKSSKHLNHKFGFPKEKIKNLIAFIKEKTTYIQK
ncbi:helix-turn-helix domain containing protein, partial [Patescibacteria group bacterium]|nr:helix-turn-helix domain containing protein [Patescibacteria group bacterium]